MTVTKKEFDNFKKEIDAWIKSFDSRLIIIEEKFKLFDSGLSNNHWNMEHNYDLINEIRTNMENLKQQTSLIKLTQVVQGVILTEKRTIKH